MSSFYFDSVIQLDPAKIFRPFPVSRNDFKLESTRGQPQATFPAIFEPVLKLSCVTMRQTMSSTCSSSKVTRDLSLSSSGSAHVRTNRFGGALSPTSPAIQTSFFGRSEERRVGK